jgi:type VI secretion system protein ImpC
MSDSTPQGASSLPIVLPQKAPVDLSRLVDIAIEGTISRGAESDRDRAEQKELASLAIEEVYREIFRQTAENQFSLTEDRINSQLIDRAIARLDAQIGKQVDAVLHHPDVQALEASWRSLRYLADRSPVSSNIKISMLSTDKDQLDHELHDQGPEKSAFFHHLYSAELGSLGGEPYAAIVSTFDFGPQPRDMRLLRNLAACASMAHAPLLASASPQLLGVNDVRKLSRHGDGIIADQQANPKIMRDWTNFRRSADSRYVSLTLPRMMMRLPYGADTLPVRSFAYQEAAAGGQDQYVWGSSAFALAACMSRSFKENRWFNRITGEKGGGLVDRLPLHTYRLDGVQEVTCPTEIYLNDNQEKTLAGLGFAALTMHRNENYAVFVGAQSAYDPSHEGQGDEAEAVKANRALGAGLPYTFIVTRVAHYLKGMMRGYLGQQVPDKAALHKAVNDWIKGYCLRNENPDPEAVLERPLKDATVVVGDWPGRPGYYRFDITIKPHHIFAGADISIGLDGFVSKDG